MLFEHPMIAFAKNGYKKNVEEAKEYSQMAYLPQLHRKKFISRMEQNRKTFTDFQSETILLFLRTFITCWLDFNIPPHDKKKMDIVAHIARFTSSKSELAAFFKCQKQGKLMSIVRDPFTWYASASKYSTEYADCEKAIRIWVKCLENTTEAAEAMPDRVLMLDFRDLLMNTRDTMGAVSKFLGIPQCMNLTPTFNGSPITSNSSFVSVKGVVSQAPLARHLELSSAELELIQRADNLYKKAISHINNQKYMAS